MTTATQELTSEQETIHEYLGESFDLACQGTQKMGSKAWNDHDGSMTGYRVWDAITAYFDSDWAATLPGHKGMTKWDSKEALFCNDLIYLALTKARELINCDGPTFRAEVKAWLLSRKEILDSEYNG